MTADDRPVASPSQTVGPFFHFGLATDSRLGRVAPPGVGGTRIRLRMVVLDGDDKPVPDALIEIYQADAHGTYPSRSVASAPATFAGFGRLATDEQGACVFETIHPGPVTAVENRVQAPHVLVCLFARGLQRQLHTRLYFAGDSGHDADPVLSLVPADRRRTLMASTSSAGTWEFVIRLQGERETVFFDL